MRLYTGVFGIGEVRAVRDASRRAFNRLQASEALQSGPLLLHRGAPVEITSGLGRYARRAVIGIDGAGTDYRWRN